MELLNQQVASSPFGHAEGSPLIYLLLASVCFILKVNMGRIFSVFLLIALIVGGFYFVKTEPSGLNSPIPKVFGITSNRQVNKRSFSTNKWFPKTAKTNFESENLSLNLSAKSALVVDYDSGEIIFGKNIKQRLPIASTVKIMTALVALENAKLKDTFLVSVKAAKVGENSMGLTAGERLTLQELLYGLMLVSGNDAAVTIAEGASKSEEAFVKLMNQTAADLVLDDTKFINASGLDEDGSNQYSSAYDLAVISRYVWENYPQLRQITSTVHEFIDANSDHKSFDLYNDTNLLTTYPGVKGIKPGFTWEAGLCLVTYAENDGKKLLAVILGSDDRRGEMKELLDYGFAHYGIKIDHPTLD